MSVIAELRSLDRHQWSAVAASFLGWTLDAFDFFLMVFMFSAISKEFHTNIAAVAIASTLTLAARPFGALIFGMLADRFGRRPVLMIDILLYSVLEFASAFAPTLTTLLILRSLFGFAMGGEWGVGASLTMETIPPKVRGIISGFLQEGYAFGYLLASAATYFLLDRIGWRGMFMVGLAPALLVVLLRLGVKESPVFEARSETRPKRGLPFLALVGVGAMLLAVGPALAGAMDKTAMLRWIYLIDAPLALCGLWVFRKHWRTAIFAVILLTAMNVMSHGAQDIYPTFLGKQHGFNTQVQTLITGIGNIGAILGGVMFGTWSERIGRRWALVTAAGLGLLVIPLWAFSHSFAMLALGAFALQMTIQGAWGVIPVHLNEISPADQRGAFPGYIYQLGNILASGCVVWQAQLAEQRHGDYGFALAVAVGAAVVVVLGITFLGPEHRGVDFVSEAD